MNPAKSIVLDAVELLECFQWSEEGYDIQYVKEVLQSMTSFTPDTAADVS